MALRREERPDEGYWKDFLSEFHRRQREEASRKSGVSQMVDRVKEWFSNLGPSKWAYGAGLAYATVAVVVLLNPKSPDIEGSVPTTPVNHQTPVNEPVRAEQLDHLDLNPSTQGAAGEQVF
jgi:hypothetical protein